MTGISVPPTDRRCDKCVANGLDLSQCPVPAIGRAENYFTSHTNWLSRNEQAVMRSLLALAREYHNVGKCAAPQDRIAKEIGITQQGVSKILQRLETYGWVVRKVKGHAGKRIASKFHILPHVTSWSITGEQAVRKDLLAPRPTRVPRQPVGPLAPSVVRGSAEPVGSADPTDSWLRGITSSNVPLVLGSSHNSDAQLSETELCDDPLTTEEPQKEPQKLWEDPLTTPRRCRHGIELYSPGQESAYDRGPHLRRGLPYGPECWRADGAVP